MREAALTVPLGDERHDADPCTTELCERVAELLGMEAAVHGSIDLFKQALMLDPLTAAVCSPDEIWQLGDELIVETARWLPQYACKTVNAARRRRKPSSSIA